MNYLELNYLLVKGKPWAPPPLRRGQGALLPRPPTEESFPRVPFLVIFGRDSTSMYNVKWDISRDNASFISHLASGSRAAATQPSASKKYRQTGAAGSPVYKGHGQRDHCHNTLFICGRRISNGTYSTAHG